MRYREREREFDTDNENYKPPKKRGLKVYIAKLIISLIKSY
jgi:hypothetical protein